MQQSYHFSARGIQASSYRGTSVTDIDFGEYDVLVLTSGWDPRCRVLAEALFSRVQICLLLLFDDKDSQGLRDQNDEKLRAFAARISEKQYEINGLSTEVDDVWFDIKSKIFTIGLELKRPLSILCDMSCCPRVYTLSLLTTCLKYGVARHIHYFYNECVYPERKDTLCDDEVAFTAGRWKLNKIHSLTDERSPLFKNRFTVSIGFEGSKTLMVLNEREPDEVIVLVPMPGYLDEYDARVRTANKELFRSFGLRSSDELHSNAADSIEVWSQVFKRFVDDQGRNEFFLCAGTKPHSLGLTLAAYSLEAPTVYYGLPERHNPIDVVLKPECWLYKIESLVVPERSGA